MRTQKETIENIAAELRLGICGKNPKAYMREVANRIEAAHIDGVLKAVEELMRGKMDIVSKT